jgi:hypothetical protein
MKKRDEVKFNLTGESNRVTLVGYKIEDRKQIIDDHPGMSFYDRCLYNNRVWV